MINLFQKFALTTAAVTAAIVVIDVAPAEADFVNLSGTINSGDLTGATYDGSFSFDTINPGGTSDVNNVYLGFTFNSSTNTFTEADAVSQPLVEFDDLGNLLGLDFSVNNASLGQITFNFSFVPGFLSAEEAAVFYDIDGGNGGAGDVVLASTDIPEPSTVLGLGMVLGVGALFKRETAKKCNKSTSKSEV
ncbi:MAG: PEP-CTERM sorting domain-containing protein [Limnoraphis sp. WC205]|nr:PEP-CTERM sorting domain-containing protein [Limnoraphis sp. WC205]